MSESTTAAQDLAGPQAVVTPVATPAVTPAATPAPAPVAAAPDAFPGGRYGRLVLAGLSGLALVAAFPGLGWWPLAAVGVAGLALAARGATARTGALVGFVGGEAFFLLHLHWSGIYVGALPWVALATLEASFVALMGAALPLAWRAPGGRTGTVAAVAGLWTAQEALRGRVPFGGFPWGRLAFSQADSPALAWASLGGASLLSAVVAASGGALAVAVAALLTKGSHGARSVVRWRSAAPALAAAFAVPLLGLAVPTPTDAPRTVRVAAVQGNVPAPGLDFNAERRAVLDNHVAATIGYMNRVAHGEAAAPGLVLWPENASDIDPLRNPDAAQVIQRAADTAGVPVVVGAVLEEPVDHLSNASIVWGPTGSTGQVVAGPGQRYVKQHPAPFGEYIPFRSFFRMFSSKVDLVRRDFAPGTRTGLLDTPAARLGDVICFEVAYDALVRDPVRHGADLVVVQTNNATFGYTDESVQQLAMSRVRAVENGRAVVHISTVGVSALIAPDGRMITTSGHFTQQVLAAELPLRTALTPATRLGVRPEVALAALGVLLVAAAALRGRRRTGGAPSRTDAGPEALDQR